MHFPLALLLSAAVLLVGYLIFRVIIRRDYRRSGKLTWGSTALEFLIFALHANLSYIFMPVPWPEMPPLPKNPFHLLLSSLLFFAGLALTLLSMANLGFIKAVGQDTETLHESGWYRFTRNPQLLFYSLMLIGWASFYPMLMALIWLAVYGVIAHWMVLTEEEHLERLYGEPYREYCQRVPRYLSLPGVQGR